jgi:hypothetical protein
VSSISNRLRVLVVAAVSTSVVAFGATAPTATAQPAPSSAAPASTAQLVNPSIGALPAASKSKKKSYRATERGLTKKTKRVHRALRAKFPQIKRVGGKRAASGGEHGKGRALDVMIPKWKSAKGKALGKRIARWAKGRSGSLKIWYVIYNQKIWNVQRKGDGWRTMRNGGSANANHRNHVHISVKR